MHGSIRIRDGKIWLEHNTTPERIGEQLIAAGIPRTSIVLGFQPHDLHHLTNFAAASFYTHPGGIAYILPLRIQYWGQGL